MGQNRYLIWIMAGDAGITFAAYAIAFLIWLGGFPAWNWVPFMQIAPFLMLTTVVMMFLYNGYRDLHRPFMEIAGLCLITTVVTVAMSALIAYLNLELRAFPRGVLIIGGLALAILLPLWRSLFVRQAKREFAERPAIFVGREPVPVSLPDYIRINGSHTPDQVLDGSYGGGAALMVIGKDVSVRERDLLTAWALAQQLEVLAVPTLYDVLVKSAEVTRLGDSPVLAFKKAEIPPEFRLFKRAIDIIASSLVLLALSPVLLVIPILIRLDSRGPVFLRQDRVGEGGRSFSVWKFRTMVDDAEKATGPVFAGKSDPRVTRVGGILRASRLDEVPQILNVFVGDMSMVGPRPERAVFVAEFSEQIPLYPLRHRVKPGITGLAQVMGRYTTSAEDKLRYDLLYITDYTPWMDLRILLWTVNTVLFPQFLVDEPPRWVGGLDWKDEYQESPRSGPK